MKRRIVVVCFVLVFCMLAVIPAAAATKKDVMNELKNTIIGNYIDIDPDNETAESIFIVYMAENAIRNVNFTEAQGDLFVQLIKECAAFVSVDKGPSAHAYTSEERRFVIDRLTTAANEMGFRIAFAPKVGAAHNGDVLFTVYDENDMIIFQYDGDMVKKTGSPNQ